MQPGLGEGGFCVAGCGGRVSDHPTCYGLGPLKPQRRHALSSVTSRAMPSSASPFDPWRH